MVDVGELVSRQRELADRLVSASAGPALREVARELAATLYDVAADDDLWSTLRMGSATTLDAERLAQLVMLDWDALLKQAGYSDDGVLAAELAGVVQAAMDSPDPDAWSKVRELMRKLAHELDADAADAQPAENGGWWRALRDKVAFGVSALRHVSMAALLSEAFKKATTTAGVKIIAMTIFGVPFGPPGPIIAAAIFGLGMAAFTELRRYFAEQQAERLGHHLDALFQDVALQRGGARRHAGPLDVLASYLDAPSIAWDGELPEDIVNQLAGLRRWSAHVGAVLASAWSFVKVHVGVDGIRGIRVATGHLADLWAALATVAKAVVARDKSAAAEAVAAARAAFIEVVDSLSQLDILLTRHGFPKHPG